MLGKNFRYKGLDFTDSVQLGNFDTVGYSIIILDNTKPSEIRQNITNKSNFHGVYTSPSLLWGRNFDFTAIIKAKSCEKKDEAYDFVYSQLQPDFNPYSLNRGFYDLIWEDCNGVEKFVKAKVSQMPEPQGDQCGATVEFTFQLQTETPDIYSTTEKEVVGGIGVLGGFTLPTTLPTPLSGYAGTITLTNEGNWNAPIEVRVEGNVVNPRIINTTNDEAYKLETTTLDLIYNNRNPNNRPTETIVVTNLGVDIREFRRSGLGVTLSPWVNELVVLADNYPNDAVVTVTFRDTYIN